MKKITAILVIICVLIGTMFIISNNSKKAAQKKAQEIQAQEEAKKQEEVTDKLETLTVTPTIEGSEENSGSVKEKVTEGLSQAELIDQEEIQILSFTNARQCNKLVFLKDACRNKFVFTLATKSNDIGYCDSLKDEVSKQDCRDEIHYNLLICTDIKNSTLKQKCEYNLKQSQLVTQKQETIKKAETSSDASLCTTITSYGEKESCMKAVILKTKDISLCNKISTNKQEQTRCAKNISYELNRALISEAYEKKDLSLCDKVTDEATKKQCKTMTF